LHLRRLPATPSLARYRAAVVPLDRGRDHAAVLSPARPNGDAARADADGGIRIVSAVTVTVITIATDLNFESLRQS
jgi:hypothetical protein